MEFDFDDLLTRFTSAVVAGDGVALAGLFTSAGVYHDTFYGAFTGRDAIRDMLEVYFHRDAEAFRWDMCDPICAGDTGYARWVFSYTSRMAESAGRRVAFEGMSCFTLRDGFIEEYDEVFNAGVGLVQLGMGADRIEKILARQVARTRARQEARRHLGADPV